MQLTDIYVIKGIKEWIAIKESFWLCTILGTYGSSPRPIGSLFAWNGEVRLGSISGGCLEDAFIEKLNTNSFDVFPTVFTYGKNLVDETVLIELPCGGSVKLLIERFTPSTYAPIDSPLKELIRLAEEKVGFTKKVDLNSGTTTFKKDKQITEMTKSIDSIISIDYHLVTTLLILGISQVSEWVAKMGLMAGYDVKVCDMRKGLEKSWTFTKDNGGIDITWRSPDLFVEENVTQNSAILALAHDPRIDDLGLLAALESNSFYIGAMGSKKTTEKRSERLRKYGDITPEMMKRLKAPIGIPIGSKTPFEISISIFSDLIMAIRK